MAASYGGITMSLELIFYLLLLNGEYQGSVLNPFGTAVPYLQLGGTSPILVPRAAHNEDAEHLYGDAYRIAFSE